MTMMAGTEINIGLTNEGESVRHGRLMSDDVTTSKNTCICLHIYTYTVCMHTYLCIYIYM